MIDKLTPNMIDMTKRAVGKYTVQLFDAETGEKTYEVCKHNMINPFYATLMFEPTYLSPIVTGISDVRSVFYSFPTASDSSGFANTLSIFESSESPENNLTMYPPDMNTICSTDLQMLMRDDLSYISNVNANESYGRLEIADDGCPVFRKHLVIDYATHQGNGKFNNIGISKHNYNSFSSVSTPSMQSDRNSYWNKSFCQIQRIKLNKSTWGVGENKISECGPISIESDITFWTCNSVCSTLGAQQQNINPGELTFYKFDISKGYLNCTQKVTLSGSPSELSDTFKYYMRYGLRFKGKFYVFSTESKFKDKMFVYSDTGSYEKTVEIVPKIQSYLNDDRGGVLATPTCMMTLSSRSQSQNQAEFRVFNENGELILQKTSSEFEPLLDQIFRDTYSRTSSDTFYNVKPIPYIDSKGELVVLLSIYGSFGNCRTFAGYYPKTNEIKALPFSISGVQSSIGSSNPYEGMSVFKNIVIHLTTTGVSTGCAIPWWSWCHLSSPITKTSATTMKIQYDIEIPMMLPCSEALYKK